jgi:hypothetical protein
LFSVVLVCFGCFRWFWYVLAAGKHDVWWWPPGPSPGPRGASRCCATSVRTSARRRTAWAIRQSRAVGPVVLAFVCDGNRLHEVGNRT